MATLYVGAGAGAVVNAFFWLRGDDYAEFADGSYIAFVRESWRSVVVPDHVLFIGLLVAFELAVGVLALRRDRVPHRTRGHRGGTPASVSHDDTSSVHPLDHRDASEPGRMIPARRA